VLAGVFFSLEKDCFLAWVCLRGADITHVKRAEKGKFLFQPLFYF
jgi:hypothetical protein